MKKINLGCGTNRLEGWLNHDKDVDITKPLPWARGSIDFVFAEHVVEHVTYRQAIAFFQECRRILRPGGVLRVAVPSVVQVALNATKEYCKFTERWVKPQSQDGNDLLRGAIANILFGHGHQTPWCIELLEVSLFYAGFNDTLECTPGQSPHEELQGIEGHGKVIGDEFNRIETVVAEATATQGDK